MTITLADLLRGLEKQAADQEEDEKETSKDEGGKDAKESEGKSSDKVEDAEKDLEEAKEKDERVKEAQLQGAALAQEIMQKVASAVTVTTKDKDQEMNKSAAIAGKALAESLLEKLAGVGDANTIDGISGLTTPNKVQNDTAAMVAEGDAAIQPTPTKDAAGNGGGSVNQIFDAIIADAQAAGAATPHELGHQSTSAVEGVTEDSGAPNQTPAEEVEKVAAVSALVQSGFDFDSAVEMVKAAEEEIRFEEAQQVKQAAFNELVESGVDFELAAALVKQANAASAVRGAASRAGAFVKDKAETVALHGMYAADRARAGAGLVADRARAGAGLVAHDARAFGQGARQAVTGRDSVGAAVGRGAAAKRALLGTYTGRAAIGAGALGAAGGAYALAREKQAAVGGLIEAGVDFDTAVQLVSDKAAELYGA